MSRKYKKFDETEFMPKNYDDQSRKILPNDFESSVEVFSANDIENVVVKARTRRKASFSFAHIFVLVICCATFIYSAVMLINWKISTSAAEDFYSELQNIFNRESAVEPPKTLVKSPSSVSLTDILSGHGNDTAFIPPEKLSYFEEMLTKLGRIRAIAARPNDVYGWIKVSGTASIDYPIMKTTDNDYYLKKLPNGTTSSSGSIFADFRTEDYILDNRHVVIYGHNMGDGSMFRDLRYFYWPSKVLSKYVNTEVEIITETGIYIYRVFSMYTTTSGDYYIDYEFSGDQDYVNFLQSRYDKNLFYGYPEAEKMAKYIAPDTKLLTLSTCTSNHLDPNERFVLHCVLVEAIEPEY